MKKIYRRFLSKFKRSVTDWITAQGDKLVILYVIDYDNRAKVTYFQLLLLINWLTIWYNLKVK